MAIPFVHANPVEYEDRTLYRVSLTDSVAIEVTVTNTLSTARMWLRKIIFYNRRHAADLQVGVACHGQRPDVLTLSVKRKCLIVSLPGVINNESCLVRFLGNGDVSFFTTGPLPESLHLHSYANALEFGNEEQSFTDLAERVTRRRIELDAAVAGGDWSTWPLSQDQILLSSVQAQVSFLAALMH